MWINENTEFKVRVFANSIGREEDEERAEEVVVAKIEAENIDAEAAWDAFNAAIDEGVDPQDHSDAARQWEVLEYAAYQAATEGWADPSGANVEVFLQR